MESETGPLTVRPTGGVRTAPEFVHHQDCREGGVLTRGRERALW